MRPTFEEFKKEALAIPEVAEEYERLSAVYALRRELIRMRQESGLSQEDVAALLHTRKSAITRLEDVHSKVSPSLAAIEQYAKAVGYRVELRFLREI